MDAAGQITNSGFTYNTNGDLTADGTRTYRYDAQHHLLRVAKADGTTLADYTYDANGLRLTKTTPAGTTKYDWDSSNQLVREIASDGTITHYTWNTSGDLATIERAGATYYPHTNARGDILAITDASGATVATYTYGPWGEPLASTGTFSQPWRYAGYYYDTDTTLYYLQQRYYDPNLSRFLSPEPIYSDFCADCGFTALLNRAPVTSSYAYAYANDRPTTLVDPDGRLPRVVKTAAHWANHHKLDIALTAATVVVPEAAGFIWAARAAQAARVAEAALAAQRAAKAERAATYLLRPSRYAGDSIPAKSTGQTFSSAERSHINNIGKRTGCHSCGSTNPGTKSGNFVPDHQPVSRLMPSAGPQRLYPQCISCSRQQELLTAKIVRNGRR